MEAVRGRRDGGAGECLHLPLHGFVGSLPASSVSSKHILQQFSALSNPSGIPLSRINPSNIHTGSYFILKYFILTPPSSLNIAPFSKVLQEYSRLDIASSPTSNYICHPHVISQATHVTPTNAATLTSSFLNQQQQWQQVAEPTSLSFKDAPLRCCLPSFTFPCFQSSLLVLHLGMQS